MQAGDRHQVPDPGATEDLPVGVANRALVTDRQRHHDAGVWRIGQALQHALAHRAAQPVHLLHEGLRRIVEQLRVAAHVAGGPDAAFQQPGLVVETVRIGKAMRALQPHHQAPALTRARRRPRSSLAPLAIPGQQHAAWNSGFGGLDVKNEAPAVADCLWQAGDTPDHHQIGPFAHPCQLVRKPPLGAQRCPAETRHGHRGREQQQRTLTTRQQDAGRSHQRQQHADSEHERQCRAGHRAGASQRGAALQQARAEQKGDRGNSHGIE